MNTSLPDLGLLLDVDGPIASPVTRAISIPQIITDLVALTAAGVPIAFITGRSSEFIREQVMTPLFAAGLADALELPTSRMFGVFEKGGTWAEVNSAGMGEVVIDRDVAFPDAAIDSIRSLVAERFSDTMFFDETKRAMISVEQRTDVTAAAYRSAQGPFQDAAFALLTAMGLGLRYGSLEHADAAGDVPFRIDPTIISTDIESVRLDKDTGARRALEHFAAAGDLPRTWRTVGDSRSDYKMADQLHADGFDVAHVDVRPADGILDRPYEIVTEGDLIHDEAGAALLAYWRDKLGV
ncbi:hypothetical protein [Microbacterium sp. A93]|uniref:hypothetical protein n=1 Tax=unclassified Microbacterium TaxID=2609290 RepID=UPI003F4265CD